MDIEMLKIPYSKLLKRGLQGNSILLYGVLLFHTYNDNKTWITNKTLSSECGVSERTVNNCLTELKDKKCIDIKFETEGRYQIRYIVPLILFDLKLVPKNYKPKNDEQDDNGGFEIL